MFCEIKAQNGAKGEDLKLSVKLLTLLVVFFGAFWIAPNNMRAQISNRAALVIRYGDQHIETACIEFEEPQISGFDLVQRSGLNIEIEAQGLGALVCTINDVGCPSSDCLCQCRGGGECIYWSYWHQLQDGWQYSQSGATAYFVKPGSVEGWSWGPGAESQALPPPVISFEDVCDSQDSNELASLISTTGKDGTIDNIDIFILDPANPDGQLLENESSAAQMATIVGEQSQAFDRSIEGSTLFEWFPYAIFLVILCGLGVVLYFISWRRRGSGLR